MILLDTDHLTVLRYADHRSYVTLIARLDAAGDSEIATSIVSVEEQMRGWLAEIHRRRTIRDQMVAYDRLLQLVELLADWEVVRLDEAAAAEFDRLKQQRVRVGSQDLKIAAIALANDALLLSANIADFTQIPGLRVENWLE